MNQERLMKVILGPLVSEKSARIGDQANQYAFKVLRDATKPEIKAAVEKLFEVKVEGVQVVNLKGKTKRFGARLGRRKDWRKAYVRLQKGQEIDLGGGA